MSKKGQEQIITTILLILIVLAAIIIVWQVIDRFIKGGSAEISSRMSCVDVRLDIISANATGTVKITRLAGGDNDAVSNIKILVNGAAATIGTAPSPTTLEPLETKTWTLSSTVNTGDEVQIAPVLNDGTICDVSDTETAVGA